MRLCFGDLMLDLQTRQLLRGGEEVRLSPKTFELLKVLIENRPRALSKSELLDHLWPKTFVAETNLSSLIAEIREATDDSTQSPKFIRTVHRFGYAFCGTASEAPVSGSTASSRLGCWLLWDARQIPLKEGENIVGREPEAEVWLDSARVSRRHARILLAGREATVEDLGSKNGTYVRGARLEAPCRVVDGDEIRIGSVVLKFRMPAAAGSTVSLNPNENR